MIPNESLPVGSQIIKKLCELFECNDNTVRIALQFKSNSLLSKKIRAKVIELFNDEINRFKWICEEGIYTETNDNKKDEGHVYVISNPNYSGKCKVGITKGIKRRLKDYQTSDPDSAYKLEYESKKTPYYREFEKYIHHKFHNEHEWVTGNLYDIIDEIKKIEEKKVIDNTKDVESFDVGRDFREELCNKYGYNIRNVYNALSFRCNIPLSKEIRVKACELAVAELDRVRNLCKEYDNSKFPTGTRGFSVGSVWIRKKLCKYFECNILMVSRALRFKRNSPLAKEIRSKAIELFSEEIKRFKEVVKNPYTIIEEDFDFKKEIKVRGLDVSDSFKKELIKEFKCTNVTVNDSLSFRSNSPLARAMRERAYDLAVAELNRVIKLCKDYDNLRFPAGTMGFSVGKRIRKKLCEFFECDNKTVGNALQFKNNSQKAKDIRQASIKLFDEYIKRFKYVDKNPYTIKEEYFDFEEKKVDGFDVNSYFREELCKECECNKDNVNRALSFISNSPLVKKIRAKAIELAVKKLDSLKDYYNGTENKICKIESFDIGNSIYKELFKHFKCSKVNVYNALSFRSNSQLQKDIRAKAYELAVKELNRFINLCKDYNNIPAGTSRFSVGWRIRKNIGENFKCSRGTVDNALQLKKNTPLKREIRQVAIKLFKEEIERFKEVCNSKDESGEKKYVYIISHPNHPCKFKVGISKYNKERLKSYNIGDPYRSYKLEYKTTDKTPDCKDIEYHILKKFDRKIDKKGDKKGEWVIGKLQDIIDEIENYKHKE